MNKRHTAFTLMLDIIMRIVILIVLVSLTLPSCRTNSNSDFSLQGTATSARTANDENYRLNKLDRKLDDSFDSLFVRTIDNSINFIDSVQRDLIELSGGFGENGLIEYLRIKNPDYPNSYEHLTTRYGNDLLKEVINRPYKLLTDQNFEVYGQVFDPIDDPIISQNPEKFKKLYWIQYFEGLNTLQTLTALEAVKENLIILERQYFIVLKSNI